MIRQRARAALNLQQWARADSLNELDYRLAGGTASYFATAAALAFERGHVTLAQALARRALAIEPDHALARYVVQELGPR